ncbi:YrhK family protein [Arthrobacter sp. FW306-07-I]|uniref:YrhK family protein n=1 Tax=Arthrobacter sp. FW306-07-I TaxID=2879622 RepID=UPI001F29735F|nr:YrhK family protein [Arthrobacter sp. FW306-07-I]UKA77128.1 YrhK family protein [Arthrobacter sp. FW306-07-I]
MHRLFDARGSQRSSAHEQVYASIEVIYTVVDFTAAGLFIIGSVLFFSPEAKVPALWCFLVGSICFALKPTLRLIRQFRYLKLDKIDKLAKEEKTHG